MATPHKILANSHPVHNFTSMFFINFWQQEITNPVFVDHIISRPQHNHNTLLTLLWWRQRGDIDVRGCHMASLPSSSLVRVKGCRRIGDEEQVWQIEPNWDQFNHNHRFGFNIVTTQTGYIRRHPNHVDASSEKATLNQFTMNLTPSYTRMME